MSFTLKGNLIFFIFSLHITLKIFPGPRPDSSRISRIERVAGPARVESAISSHTILTRVILYTNCDVLIATFSSFMIAATFILVTFLWCDGPFAVRP